MVQSRCRLAATVLVVLAASVGCSSNAQGTGAGARPTSGRVIPRAASSPTPSSTASTASRGDALSVTTVRAYRRGLVLAAARAGAGVGRPQRVLVSTNHGATFTDITPAGMRGTRTTWVVDDIVARGPARLWVAVWDADSTKETVYRTTDGGGRWQAAPAPGHDAAAGAMDSISFVDAHHGWLVQQMPTAPISALYRTSDAGAHWQPVDRRLPQVAPVVPDLATGLWQGGGAFSDRLLHSTDGGQSWASADLGRQPGRATLVGRPTPFSGQMLEAVSGLTRDGEVLRFHRTRNGVSWSDIARLGPLSDEPSIGGSDVRRAQLAFATANAWWVIADDPQPTVYRTTDAGRHWTSARLPGTSPLGRRPFVQIASSDERQAWATVAGRDTTRLLATTDGGRTWSVVDLAKRLGRATSTAAARLPRCRSAQLTARVAESGSVALRPGATASFSIGTATAYDLPLVTVTRLLVRLPASTQSLPVHVQMGATAPRGRPLPVGVTAVQRGVPAR